MACGDSQPLVGIQAACAERPAYAPLSRRPRFGKVVNIGSNLVYNPVVTYYDYTAAKAALVGLTRNLAAELGPSRTCRKDSGLRDRGYLRPAFVLDTGRQMLPVPSHLVIRTQTLTGGLTTCTWQAIGRARQPGRGRSAGDDGRVRTHHQGGPLEHDQSQHPPLDPPFPSRAAVHSSAILVAWQLGTPKGRSRQLGTPTERGPTTTFVTPCDHLGRPATTLGARARATFKVSGFTAFGHTQVFGFVSAGTPLRKTTTVNDFAEVSVMTTSPNASFSRTSSRLPSDAYA